MGSALPGRRCHSRELHRQAQICYTSLGHQGRQLPSHGNLLTVSYPQHTEPGAACGTSRAQLEHPMRSCSFLLCPPADGRAAATAPGQPCPLHRSHFSLPAQPGHQHPSKGRGGSGTGYTCPTAGTAQQEQDEADLGLQGPRKAA